MMWRQVFHSSYFWPRYMTPGSPYKFTNDPPIYRPGVIIEPAKPKRIPVWYYEEVGPGTSLNYTGRGVKPDLRHGGLFDGADGKLKLLHREGDRLFLLTQI